MMGGSKMNKLQKNFPNPDRRKSADWKKWGKLAASGVAGMGALAADAAGDMADGLAGMSFEDSFL
jgi:hypothetical protein